VTSLLELNGLSKRFGGVVAVDHLNLTIATAELLCVIGPNGCGKTTLFNLISGEIASDEGRVVFSGKNLCGLKPFEVARRGIVRKFQVPSVFDDMSVGENLTISCHIQGMTAKQIKTGIDQKLMEVGLARSRDEMAGNLSHGQKQWLEIAMVLATSPALLLLDEPTAGMTRAETAKTVELIKSIHQRRQMAMIVIEHDMKFVEALGSRVAAMMAGQIITTGAYEKVANDPRVKEAYLGASAT
jgi:ABC-type uncharacterized transport system ATPase subunit